jgi:large subunit ribosomal protein L21
MYVIFETGGKQYKAVAGETLRVEKLPGAVGDKISFDRVLAVSGGKETLLGTPYLDAATVNATVTDVGRGEKVIVFKFKAKKNYRRKQGHRQPFTEIEIESVSVGGKIVLKKEAPKETEKPAPVKSGETDDKAEDGTKKGADKAADAETDVKKPEDEAAGTVNKEEQPVADAPKAAKEKPDGGKAEEAAPEEAPKMTKADIIAKLDELGASYAKSAKKDELLEILAEAEKK